MEEQQLLATSVDGRTVLMYASRCRDQMSVLSVTHACKRFLHPSKVSCSHSTYRRSFFWELQNTNDDPSKSSYSIHMHVDHAWSLDRGASVWGDDRL